MYSSKALTTSAPVVYCRQTHDLYVNHDATVSLCRLGSESLDLWEEVKERDSEFIRKKMEIAMRRISGEQCCKYLKGI